ncbi:MULTISPECIES: nitroreductase family protein [Carboxydocella]|uniref:Nitroreductase n=2 Tax=Carboxydocella TaxID=178898 RepID=A0A1T4SDS8_9FIRM|nr:MULTISPECIES: nitroreductase family protein [Carboxydocella]AVX19750.1 Nitroreductase [Carboxydocella thermautotrophica]GAW29811.1 nitroreductase [Carboxydocella sp. ULO1]GAW31384.1 nitroreductase [Carboxydocella sp. JDF658]SKA26450.1 Nitroreductase [Carboxydocella sporoproducens DSM 16521]
MLELLQKRRSIRRFTDQPVEKEKIEKILQAALLAPSSRSLRPWEFIVIQDKSLLQQLAKAKAHSISFLAEAPLGIAVIADENKCDVWIEDASIATILMQLAATSLGLGSCWIQIRLRQTAAGQSSEEYVKEVLQVPAPYRVLALLAIGYPAETRSPASLEQLAYDKIHYNQYSKNPVR